VERRTVSRVLSSKPSPADSGDDHSSRPSVAGRFKQSYPGASKAAIAPLFDLAPGRVCRASSVTSRAVGSYPTVSPLPTRAEAPVGGLLSVALSVERDSRPGRLAVSQYLCFRSPDFPPAAASCEELPAIIRPAPGVAPTRVIPMPPLLTTS